MRLYHVTNRPAADRIIKEGFIPSLAGEVGPGVYLTDNPELVPRSLWKWQGGLVNVLVDTDARFLQLNNDAPNVPLHILRQLTDHETGTGLYDKMNDQIWTGSTVNWPLLHHMIQDKGYQGIHVGQGSSRHNNYLVFDPKNVRPINIVDRGSEKPAAQAWVRRNCRFAMEFNENLRTLLAPPGQYPGVGHEHGSPVEDGISVFQDPNGSFRYVLYIGGIAVAGMQVMSREKGKGILANAFTHPDHRRKGYATQVLNRIRQDFPHLEYSKDRSEAGAGFVSKFESRAWVVQNCRFARQPVTVYKPQKDEDKAMDQAEIYFGLGHADEDSDADTASHVTWVWDGSDIQTAPGTQSHGMVWGHDFCDRTWKGRYEGDTGRLSTVSPRANRTPPQWLLDRLEQKFRHITEVHSF